MAIDIRRSDRDIFGTKVSHVFDCDSYIGQAHGRPGFGTWDAVRPFAQGGAIKTGFTDRDQAVAWLQSQHESDAEAIREEQQAEGRSGYVSGGE